MFGYSEVQYSDWLVVGPPLWKNMKVNWDDYSQYIGKQIIFFYGYPNQDQQSFLQSGKKQKVVKLTHDIHSGWWFQHPSEKYESQLGWWLFPIYGKIKNVPNHQPAVIMAYYYTLLMIIPWKLQRIVCHRSGPSGWGEHPSMEDMKVSSNWGITKWIV